MNQNTCGCSCGGGCGVKSTNIKTDKKLTITWQRLISEGNTCPRCGSTEDELNKAVLLLREKLSPLGIEVTLEKKELNPEEFKEDPKKSNQILFNDQLLEDVIGAKTGQSQCCDVCGDEQCRTVETGGESLETIPTELIVKAGLKAVGIS